MLRTAYGAVVVNRDVSLTIEHHETVTILGPNGAGKSTLLRAISGLLRRKNGTIRLDGKEVAGLPADRMAAGGVVMVPEGRRIFSDLSVQENLRFGAYCRKDRDAKEVVSCQCQWGLGRTGGSLHFERGRNGNPLGPGAHVGRPSPRGSPSPLSSRHGPLSLTKCKLPPFFQALTLTTGN